MFTFDDLVKIDYRGIQELIKGINNEKWNVALKTASEAVRELVFKNMSERAAKMLREDMEAMSAVKLSDVEAIQSDIVQTARKLEQEGKIIIASGDSAYVYIQLDSCHKARCSLSSVLKVSFSMAVRIFAINSI